MKHLFSFLILGIAICFQNIALAGIEAKVTIIEYNDQNEKVTREGKFFQQDNQVAIKEFHEGKPRLDFLYNKKTRNGTTVFHTSNQFMEIDLTSKDSFDQSQWSKFASRGAVLGLEEFKKRGYKVKVLGNREFQDKMYHSFRVKGVRDGKEETYTFWLDQEHESVPVRVLLEINGVKVSERTLSDIEKKDINFAAFKPPSNYESYRPKIVYGGGIPEEDEKPKGTKSTNNVSGSKKK